jgi:hypothetical protein
MSRTTGGAEAAPITASEALAALANLALGSRRIRVLVVATLAAALATVATRPASASSGEVFDEALTRLPSVPALASPSGVFAWGAGY